MSNNDKELPSIPNQNASDTQETVQDRKIDEKEFSNILKVKADDKDISSDERVRKVKLLAGAIAHGLRQFGNVYVRCFSPACPSTKHTAPVPSTSRINSPAVEASL